MAVLAHAQREFHPSACARLGCMCHAQWVRAISARHRSPGMCLGWLAVLLLVFGLVDCGLRPPSKARPLSHWANPNNVKGDECTAVTAQAIPHSGHPYPHATTEPYTDGSGQVRQGAKTVGVWVGHNRCVLPAKLVGKDVFARWESVTKGNSGLTVPVPTVLVWSTWP